MAENMSEKEQILAAMKRLAEGKFEGVDPEAFEDKAFAEEFNANVLAMAKHNNNYLMRVNESMGQIGNINWIKAIFEIINEQSTLLSTFYEHQNVLKEAEKQTDEYGTRVLALVKQVESCLTPSLRDIEEQMREIDALKDKGILPENNAKRIMTKMQFHKANFEVLQDTARSTVEYVKSVYDAGQTRAGEILPLLTSIGNLADSCNALTTQCFNAGLTMYTISRVVDNVRNDMFRHNSLLGMQDSLKIYAIDHLVLTWRIYNHIQEYETLVINQLNNPDRCKFGLWCANTAPVWLKETDAFQEAFNSHLELHNHAVAAFEAKENANNTHAMMEFEKLLAELDHFLGAIEKVREELRKHDITEETELLVGI